MKSKMSILSLLTASLLLSGCAAMYQNGSMQSTNNTQQTEKPEKKTSAEESEDLAVANTEPVIDEYLIQNSPILPPNRIITISATGLGVPPTSTISPAQAIALAKRAAMVDAYRQLGEKMFGLRINATDTIEDMASKSSLVKTKVLGVIKNARITENTMKDGLCQVTMEVKLDGQRWHRILSRR